MAPCRKAIYNTGTLLRYLKAIPALRKQREEFKDSLVYRSSSRKARDMYRNILSKKQTKPPPTKTQPSQKVL